MTRQLVIDIILCLITRLVLIIQLGFSVYFMFFNSNIYYTIPLILFLIVIIIDSAYIVVKRKGREYKWFSISCLAYSLGIILLIWNIVSKKVELYPDSSCAEIEQVNNETESETKILLPEWIFINFDLCQLMEISVSLYILTCCFIKWTSPIKERNLKDKAFLNILISYITNGADIVDFFSQVDDSEVLFTDSFVLVILIYFTLSSLQFCFGLSATAKMSTKRFRSTALNRFFNLIFGTEVWALILVFFLQDMPFSIIRLLILINYKQLSKNYNLYFFVIKNILLALFEIYLVFVTIYNEKKLFKRVNQFESRRDTELHVF